MKQFSAKRSCCNVLNLKNGITILKGVVIFLLFSVGATAHTSFGITAPGKTNSVNGPSCVAGFTFTTDDRVAYFTSTSTDTDANTEYRWNFGDGGISHQKNPIHHYATGGIYTTCLTIINTALSCFDSVCHTVTITQCQAAFDTTVTGNLLTVSSTSTGVDANTIYTWNFGDGGIGHQANQTHTYSTGGTYNVCLTISNTRTGCSSQLCENVTTLPFVSTCQASFDTSVNVDQLTVTSTSTGVSGNTVYTWNFGDGTIGHQSSQTHTYSPTIKICSLPVTLTNSIDTASSVGLQVMININSASYSAEESAGLQNVEFTTGPKGSGTPLQAWIESGASNTSTNTVYWVNLASNIIPASGTLTIYMNFMSSNIMSATGPTGEAGQLSATFGQYDNGSLVFPDVYTNWGGLSGGSVPSGISIIGSPTITNFANYTSYVLNPNDCCSPDVLYYNTTPASASGTTVMETYTSMDGAYMWWGTNDGQGDGDAPGIIVSWDAGCIYQDYSMKDGGNCYDLQTPVSTTPYIWTIELANNNYVTAMDNNYTQVLGPQATDQSVANPQYFGYFGTTQNDGYGGNDEADIYWTRTRIYPPGGVLPTVTLGPLACTAGVKYNVCLTISDAGTGCSSTTCDSVTIEPFATTCQAAFNSSTDDLAANFTDLSTGTDINTAYNWNFGDGGVSHDQNPTHHYSTTGTYTTCLTISNKATGCFDSVCHEVTITQCQASFSALVNDNTITVTSTSTGVDGNTVYDWTFGDGGIGHQPTQTHIFAANQTICGVPLILTNNQSSATPTNFQQMVTINSSTYSSSESAGLENVEFTTGPEGEGNVLQAWAESGASNSSTSTIWWVNLGSATIPANGNLTIYMNFMPSNVMSPAGPTGEAPQLSGTYGQYDNGALVFPAYTAWGGLSGGNVPAGISSIGSPGITNNATYTELNFNNCCSAQGAYYTTTPASAGTNPTVLESYNSLQGNYMWYGTGNGVEEGGQGVVICEDYPGFSNTYFGIKSDNQNYQDLTSATLTPNPVIWSILIQDDNTLNSILENYTQVLGQQSIYANSPQYYGYFGTDQNGGSDLADIYWTRTRAYPPNGVMPGSSSGSMACAQRGIYNVCLNINNTATGCNSATCQNVVVGIASTCQAGFKDSTSSLLAYFTDTSSGTNNNTTYLWNFGDGGISHQQNPLHHYGSTGSYTACLTIANSATGCSDSVCHTITITQCQASFDTTVTGFVLGVTSTSTGVDTNTVYDWNFGDGGIGHQATQSHIYQSAGTYNVCLTISNTVTGCNSQFCENVIIEPFVSTCHAGFKDSTSDLVVYYTDTSSGTDNNTSYEWLFGDGTISHEQSPTHHYAQGGTYVVCLEISNSQTNCFSVACSGITLTQCVASFDTLVNGLRLNVTSTSTGVDSNTVYTWSFGDGGIGHQSSQSHTYATSGTYKVCLTISNTITGCSDSTCENVVTLKAVNVCGADFTSSANGLAVNFTNTSTGTTSATQYHWTFGDDSISHQKDPLHNYKKEGTYTVCLTITDSTLSFCDSTICKNVTVRGLVSECTARFTWVNLKGKGVQFNSTSQDTTNNTKYSWNLGDGTTLQNEVDPTHRYTKSGTYYVCLTITDSTETYCNSTFCDSVPFVLTGIEELSFPGTSLYYDPSTSQLVLNWAANDNVVMHLVDMLGRNTQDIYMGNLSTGTYRFNVNSSLIASGIYFVHITATDGDKAWKIFVMPH